MLKHFTPLLLLSLTVTVLRAQTPGNSNNYYQPADGQKAAALKTALADIIRPHTQRSYTDLWTDFRTTDQRADGKVWDMYSNTTHFTFGTDQAGNYRKEGDVYNREHSFPKSWFNDGYPMYTDLFHLYPTDGYVNSRRSNCDFGEVGSVSYSSNNGFSKLGKAKTELNYPSNDPVFEPADEYKGDFARTYFYMVTCYEKNITGWNNPTLLDGNTYPGLREWALAMFIRWAKNDPVSQKEVNRNEAVYGIQHNRNPFIDYPGLEQYVWGTEKATAFSYNHYQSPQGYPSITTGVPVIEYQIIDVNAPVYNLQGVRMKDNAPLPPGIYVKGGRKFVVK